MFEAFKRILRRGEQPRRVVQDPCLGELKWSEDEESWLGSFQGRAFSLAYDGSSLPSAKVRAYAGRVLGDPSWLLATLASAKIVAQDEFPSFYRVEIESLTFGQFHFSVHRKRGEYLLADLEGGDNYRLWRIEYSGSTCRGIGFDS